MLRRSIGLWVVIVSFTGIGMFLLKHEVQTRKSELDSLHERIVENQGTIRVLRAEWSHLNQPARIEALTRKYLGFRPTESHQLISITEFTTRQKIDSAKRQ